MGGQPATTAERRRNSLSRPARSLIGYVVSRAIDIMPVARPFLSVTSPAQSIVPRRRAIGFERRHRRRPPQRQHVPARPVLQAELSIVPAHALTAADALIGIDQNFHGTAL